MRAQQRVECGGLAHLGEGAEGRGGRERCGSTCLAAYIKDPAIAPGAFPCPEACLPPPGTGYPFHFPSVYTAPRPPPPPAVHVLSRLITLRFGSPTMQTSPLSSTL